MIRPRNSHNTPRVSPPEKAVTYKQHMPSNTTFGPEDTQVSETTQNEITPVSVQGHVDPGDLDIPLLNITSRTSSVVPGEPGQIVLDKTHIIYDPGVKVPARIITVQKRWAQDVPFDDDTYPKYADTPEEAQELEDEGPYPVIRIGEFRLMIEHTDDCLLKSEDDVAEAFPYELNGKFYALARITGRKHGYDTTFSRVNTFMMTNPTVDLGLVVWNFWSMPKSSGKYNWHIPALSSTRQRSLPEVANFIENLKGGPA